MTPEALAKAGFRYTNQHDMVICDYCDGRLQRWEETDNPVEEHVRHYGNRCPFMFPLLRVRILFIKIAETSFLVLIFDFISLYQVYTAFSEIEIEISKKMYNRDENFNKVENLHKI